MALLNSPAAVEPTGPPSFNPETRALLCQRECMDTASAYLTDTDAKPRGIWRHADASGLAEHALEAIDYKTGQDSLEP